MDDKQKAALIAVLHAVAMLLQGSVPDLAEELRGHAAVVLDGGEGKQVQTAAEAKAAAKAAAEATKTAAEQGDNGAAPTA